MRAPSWRTPAELLLETPRVEEGTAAVGRRVAASVLTLRAFGTEAADPELRASPRHRFGAGPVAASPQRFISRYNILSQNGYGMFLGRMLRPIAYYIHRLIEP